MIGNKDFFWNCSWTEVNIYALQNNGNPSGDGFCLSKNNGHSIAPLNHSCETESFPSSLEGDMEVLL
jgi:hypothetical protein